METVHEINCDVQSVVMPIEARNTSQAIIYLLVIERFLSMLNLCMIGAVQSEFRNFGFVLSLTS